MMAGTGALVVACGCGAAGADLPVPRVDVGSQVVVLTGADGEVCATSRSSPNSASPACVPVTASDEPVVSATLARLGATTDVVMVLTRPDVVVQGLGAGTARATIRSDGRELLVWLGVVSPGTETVCTSYLAPEGPGRLVVHRSVTVTAADAVAVEPEPDDGC